MYLEGLGVPRDYARAMYYFSNASNPLFNSSNHVFGRGVLHFYGLGVPRNESLGCRLFEEASRLTAGKGVFSYSTNRGFFLRYYLGLCALKRREFLRARDHFTAGIFQDKFAPSIDAVGGNVETEN